MCVAGGGWGYLDIGFGVDGAFTLAVTRLLRDGVEGITWMLAYAGKACQITVYLRPATLETAQHTFAMTNLGSNAAAAGFVFITCDEDKSGSVLLMGGVLVTI